MPIREKKKPSETILIIVLVALMVGGSALGLRMWQKSKSRRVSTIAQNEKSALETHSNSLSAPVSAVSKLKSPTAVRKIVERHAEMQFSMTTSEPKVKLNIGQIITGSFRDPFLSLNPSLKANDLKKKNFDWSKLVIPAGLGFVIKVDDRCLKNPGALQYQVAVNPKNATVAELTKTYELVPCASHIFLNGSIADVSTSPPTQVINRRPTSIPASSRSMSMNPRAPKVRKLNSAVTSVAVNEEASKLKNPRALLEFVVALIDSKERLETAQKNWLRPVPGEILEEKKDAKLTSIAGRSVRIKRRQYELGVSKTSEIADLNNLIVKAVEDGARIIIIPAVELSAVYTAVAFAAVHRVQVVTK